MAPVSMFHLYYLETHYTKTALITLSSNLILLNVAFDVAFDVPSDGINETSKMVWGNYNQPDLVTSSFYTEFL